MLPKLTPEQMRRFLEQQKLAREGKLIGFCNVCKCFYQKEQGFIYFNICKECLIGVKIPSF